MAIPTYSFTNRFGGPTLRQRIRMINGRRSSALACWRYVAWTILMGTMAFACRHKQADYDGTIYKVPDFPLTNATRVLAAELDKPGMPWFVQTSSFTSAPGKTITINGRRVFTQPLITYPQTLYLHDNHLALKLPDGQQARIFINGQASSVKELSALTFEQVDDLFVYQKWDDLPGADKFPETYRIFVSTTHQTPKPTHTRIKWKQFMLANAVSDNPLGKSSTFSMNKLLEATFFSNKLAFVNLTKDNYLKLYDEYTTDIDLYINGLPADIKTVESVHVREVDKLYTRERSFEEWIDGPKRQHRFTLFIQTAPKRAKRDSSYYVFSPFYSGDF